LGPYNWVEQLAWSPDGSSIVSIDAEDEIHLWDVNSGKTLRKWNARKVGRYHFCSPDTHIVVSASSEELTMHFWRMNTGEEFFACEHESGDVPDLVWSPMSKHIASTKGNIVYLWQVS
jgi:WD40 repeat protein